MRPERLIRVHYDPGCAEIRGKHFHRHCPCGATWAERSWGARHDHVSCVTARCCPRPEVEYHSGHTTTRTTERYTHAAPGYLLETVQRISREPTGTATGTSTTGSA